MNFFLGGKALARLSGALLLLSSLSIQAQFSHAKLQATGLTCALCSKAIHESLTQLPFIESVTPELKTSSFEIRFKPTEAVPVRAMRTAVEEAGFFIGSLILTPSGTMIDSVRSASQYREGGMTYRLLEASKEAGRYKVLEKGFLVDKEYKRLSARYPDITAVSDSVVFLLPLNK